MGYLLAKALRTRLTALACFGVVLAALFLPEQGVGLPLCTFRALTGLPCLGCGLTRSFIGMAHLDVPRALFYHPLGVVLFPFVAALALTGVLPAGVRDRCAGWAESCSRPIGVAAWVVLAVLIAYGVGRIGWVFSRPGHLSPW